MYRMTNEQIENLKREVLDGLHQQIRDELSPSGMILATIDFLASQSRLLADGCVVVPIEPTADMMQAGSQVWKDADIGTWGHAACVYRAMIETYKEKK